MGAGPRLHAVALLPALLLVQSLLLEWVHPIAPLAPAAPSVAPAGKRPAPAASTPVATSAPSKAPPRPEAVEISGSLADSVDGKPVQGAEVSLPELDLRARSGTDGRFMLGPAPSRKRGYEVLVTCSGYASQTVVARTKPGQPKLELPAIRLKPKGWELPGR